MQRLRTDAAYAPFTRRLCVRLGRCAGHCAQNYLAPKIATLTAGVHNFRFLSCRYFALKNATVASSIRLLKPGHCVSGRAAGAAHNFTARS